MRKIKTTLLLALATGVLGVFSAPALAEEYDWSLDGDLLAEPVAIQLDGKGKFTHSYSNVKCDIEGEATLAPGGAGEVTKFDLSACTTGVGFCQFDGFSNDVPWSIHIDQAGRPVIESMSFGTLFKSPCSGPFNWGPVDMTGHFSTEFMTNVDFTGNDQGRTVSADLDVLAPGLIRIEQTG